MRRRAFARRELVAPGRALHGRRWRTVQVAAAFSVPPEILQSALLGPWSEMREPQARVPRYAVAMPELLRQFLSPAEVLELQAIAAAAADGWAPGRQATGYDILPLRARLPGSPVLARALAKIGTPFEDYWDAYFIRYLEGARIPPHVDPALHGKRHRRLNAVLTQAASGGELFVAGVRVDLAVGDAVLFSPDRETHEVTAVGGSRLLFSVGAWV